MRAIGWRGHAPQVGVVVGHPATGAVHGLGGMRAGLEFMARNLRYPTKAREAGKQGRVIVQFVVREDGLLSDFKVLRPVDPWLDAEAIRVISTMPKWKPATVKDKTVRCRYTVPVTFKLQ